MGSFVNRNVIDELSWLALALSGEGKWLEAPQNFASHLSKNWRRRDESNMTSCRIGNVEGVRLPRIQQKIPRNKHHHNW